MSIELKKKNELLSLIKQYNINKDKYIIPSIDINNINIFFLFKFFIRK